MSTHIFTYFFMNSRTKYTKNVLVGSPAVLVRDKIHCNKYPGTRRVISVGYPGSKISTRFSRSVIIAFFSFSFLYGNILLLRYFWAEKKLFMYYEY